MTLMSLFDSVEACMVAGRRISVHVRTRYHMGGELSSVVAFDNQDQDALGQNRLHTQSNVGAW